MHKKIYIICPVTIADATMKEKLEDYTEYLECRGYEVHLPHRDTDQISSALEICMENGVAMQIADEIHIVWDDNSKGSHFDLGVVFAFDLLIGKNKEIKFIDIDNEDLPTYNRRTFQGMIQEWIKIKE